ncbi:MAG: HAD family phosphatase [Burkholderiales bacterium]
MVNPKDIDVVLFDLGGVLIELAGVEQMLAWSRDVATTEELWRRWLHSEAVRRFETGRTGRDTFAREIVAEFGLPVPPEEFLAAFTWWPRAVLPGAHDLVAAVRARHRVASVSNTNEIHWDRFSNAWLLHEAFDHNFPSHLVGKLKPDADYFAHVVEDLAVRPERVLFIDDNAINVAGAARAGLHAQRVVGVDGARAAFVELGLLPPA